MEKTRYTELHCETTRSKNLSNHWNVYYDLRARSFRTKYEFDTGRVSSSRFLLLLIRAVYVSKCRGFGGRFHSSHSGIDFDPCISMQNYWFYTYGTMMDRDETRPQASKNDCKILDVNRILRLSSQTSALVHSFQNPELAIFAGWKKISATLWIVSKVLFVICIYDFGESRNWFFIDILLSQIPSDFLRKYLYISI